MSDRYTPEASHWLLGAGLALAAAGPILAWSFSHALYSEFAIPKLLALCGGLVLAGWGAMLSRPAGPSSLDKPWLGVIAAWGLAAVFSSDWRVSLLGHYGGLTYGLWQVCLYACLYRLAAGVAAGEENRILRIGVAAAALAAFYAVLQALGLEPFMISDLPVGNRAVSTIGSPVFLGAALALWLPVALHLAFSGEAGRTSGRLGAVLIAAGIWATISRAAWVAALAGTVLYLALAGRLRMPRWSRRSWLLVSLAAALALGLGAAALARRGLGAGQEQARVQLWRVAARTFAAQPWLGQGPDTFELSFRLRRPESYVRRQGMAYQIHAHNDGLQVLATTGVVGFAAYLWLLAALIMAALRACRKDATGRAAALAAGLASLYLVLQVDTVSVPALCGAALFAGLLCRQPQPASGSGRRWLPACLAAFAAASLLLAGRLAAADREYRLARIAKAGGQGREALKHHQESLAWDRCELTYHAAFSESLTAAAGQTSGGQARDALLDLLNRSGAAAKACHPEDPWALRISGEAKLLQTAAGRGGMQEAAEKDLDAAVARDPYQLPLLASRLKAAQLRGDKTGAQRWQERLAYVESLAAGRR